MTEYIKSEIVMFEKYLEKELVPLIREKIGCPVTVNISFNPNKHWVSVTFSIYTKDAPILREFASQRLKVPEYKEHVEYNTEESNDEGTEQETETLQA